MPSPQRSVLDQICIFIPCVGYICCYLGFFISLPVAAILQYPMPDSLSLEESRYYARIIEAGSGGRWEVYPKGGAGYQFGNQSRLVLVAQEDGSSTSPIGMSSGNFGDTRYHTHQQSPYQAGIIWRLYYYAGGQRVAMRQGYATGNLFFLLADQLGSTSKTVSESGIVVGEMRYKAWGETRYTSGTTPTNRRYTGQLAAEAGLYFYNARWYDPYLNRWIQPDTIIPDLNNPLDFDRYSYVRNNPVNFNDPSGKTPWQLFAGDGDVWNPPLASYGVTLSDGWTLEDQVQIAAELQMTANKLTSSCPDGNCFGMAPNEVFHKVFGDTTITRKYDGEGIGCGAGNPIECGEGTGGQLILNDQNGLIIHEFGHNFDHKIDGWGFARNTLGNSTISVNGFHVSGYNPSTRTYERTERGYRSDNRPDVQHPLSMDEAGNTSGEDFADMFMNFIRGSFSNDPFGAARNVWMTGNMTYWMQTISSGW